MKNPKILTVDELALYLDVSRATLYNWIKDDPTFPSRRKLGPRLVVFMIDEIDEWIASRPSA